MNKIAKIYYVIIGILIVLLIVAEYYKPKPFDWNATFDSDDKIPFGTYILYNTLPEIFPQSDIINVDSSANQVLSDSAFFNLVDHNYIFIDKSVNFSADETDMLIEWIKKGNNVFIATEDINVEYWEKKLNISIGSKTNFFSAIDGEIESKFNVINSDSNNFKVNLVNPGLKSEKAYGIFQSYMVRYIASFDTSRSTVLGNYSNGDVNFIAMELGEGKLYLSSVPYAFTNFNMLRGENHEYVYKSLSYLPSNNNIIWDEHYSIGSNVAMSPLRYFLSQPALTWAYYVAIGGIVVYIIFAAKRKQSAIPIIEAPRNSTVEFVQTISNLYLQNREHKKIATKKIKFFLEFIRNKYRLTTSKFDDEFYVLLSKKSGVDENTIRSIFQSIKHVNESARLDFDTLKQVNEKIEKFYKKVNYERN